MRAFEGAKRQGNTPQQQQAVVAGEQKGHFCWGGKFFFFFFFLGGGGGQHIRRKKKSGFYGMMVDEGTVERFVGAGRNRRNGKATAQAKKAYKAGKLRSVGSVAPRPFAKQAESATLGAGRGSFLKYMKEALDYVLLEIPKKPSKKYQGAFKRKFSG